jgi:hypothetical protein
MIYAAKKSFDSWANLKFLDNGKQIPHSADDL